MSTKAEPIPENIIDDILRTGSNYSRSQMCLIHNFMREQTMEEYTAFVKDEYRCGGKGFLIDGKEYAAWFGENGMQIAAGQTVCVPSSDKIILSWENVTERIQSLLKQGEYAEQSVLDAARENVIKEHAETLSYMIREMSKGVAAIVFKEEDLPHFHTGYPEVTNYLEEKLNDNQWLSELIKRLSGLAKVYEKDHSVMRSSLYNPVKVLKQFQVLAKETIPFQAKEGFTWTEPKKIITQDEIDAYLTKVRSSEYRLKIYSFFLLNKDEKDRADFIKREYGIGGSSHALSGADNSCAEYDGKGLSLTRDYFTDAKYTISLTWKKVAKRIEQLINDGRFITKKDKALMPGYERGQMATNVLLFYNRLPKKISRPFTDSFFWEGPKKEVKSMLEDPEKTKRLLQQMDAALSALPKDFTAYQTDYQKKADTLAKLHQYVEGEYTIFPDEDKPQLKSKETKIDRKSLRCKLNDDSGRKVCNVVKSTLKQEIGHQMTIFDYLTASV